MSLFELKRVMNGGLEVDWFLYRCDECGIKLPEQHPRYSKANIDYCYDCAFRKELITEKQYLSVNGIGLSNARAGVDPYTNKIYIWAGKRPPWKPHNSRRRSCTLNTQWRNNVFKRDNYTCRKCGKVGGVLNAHHIKSWAKHPELRYILSNGITLCLPCHKGVRAEVSHD